ncbi:MULTISPECIES: hypothetical protein [Pseudoalteromonas]|uniref:Peptidase n=1 Tax=Pseudoalteromonas rhizosphaerae TaxID=2518973 RepID=A0ABW8KYT7_9GAMM|nr:MULTISPECIES: hypothetical protein [Pseudoalteromonas]MBB1410041.1 hypothetical protein [Pseudoalteromonas sp. SG44-17]
MDKRIFKHARKFHKWLGYLLALQIFAWLLGGLIMSAIPLEKVHGKHLAARQLNNPFKQADYLASVDNIVAQITQPRQISYSHFLTIPTIIVSNSNGEYSFNGVTGRPLVAPSKAQIIANAQAHLLINAQVTDAIKLAKGTREVGFKENIWQVNFDDTFNTTLYLSADSGQVITVRSTIWRIFDFFWMLHIMDYDQREDFNNPLLISFAASSILFCLTGFILLLQNIRFRKRTSRRPSS